MIRSVFTLLVLLFAALTVYGDGYGYVCDSDLYALVRAEPRGSSPVVDTVYHLQVLGTGEELNGWVEAAGGWIHGSRLRPLPGEITGRLEGFDCHRNTFIAGPDVPHVLLSFLGGTVRLPGDKLYSFGGGGEALTLVVEEGAAAYDMRTGEQLWEWDFPTYCRKAEIYHGRIIVYDEFSVVSFHRDVRGKTCRTLVPIYTWYPYPQAELETVLNTAGEILRLCEGREDAEAREISRSMTGTNNFEFLNKLRTAYLAGDERGLEYYPVLLRIADCDGGDCHGLDYLYAELNVIQNSGIACLD